MDLIRIRGARTHNLRSVDLDLPRGAFIVVTGLSGSGKSSLAFDTLYAEGQRRYVESLSAYARQFLQLMEKPDVDSIEGLSPAIAIQQKSASHNPRSTVGTVTEIHDYLRLLWARVGEPHCPDHGVKLASSSVAQMVDRVLSLPQETRIAILAPLVTGRKGESLELIDDLRARGFVRLRVDGKLYDIDDLPKLVRGHRHTIEVVVDRLRVRPDARQRLAESIETALRHSDGRVVAVEGESDREHVFSSRFACPECGFALTELEPRLFSFNNPAGACPGCDGIGTVAFLDPERVVAFPELSLASGAIHGWDRRNQFYFQMLEGLAAHYGFDIETPWEQLPDAVRAVILNGSGVEKIRFMYSGDRGKSHAREHPFEGILPNLGRRMQETDSSVVREELGKYMNHRTCPECEGTRLRREARHVRVGERSIFEASALSLRQAHAFFDNLHFDGAREAIAARIVREIATRLAFLNDVGLDYLSLDRSADTLSGGESQRIRLASQIGSGLTGVLYVLDEPSIGLHQRDNERLLATLKSLRDLGNTLIVVEHDRDTIVAADHVVDMGPGAGEHGGRVVAAGTPAAIIADPTSVTGRFLAGTASIGVPARRRRRHPDREVALLGARGNNLQDVTLRIPTGLLTCVTGVSGSGKSTLVNDTLCAAAARHLYGSAREPASHDRIDGLDQFDKVVNVDQAPIGRTPRSNPATYTGLFTPIRELFAGVPESRRRGYGPGRFSFNVKGGRCETCQGDGVLQVEMHFLPDIYVTCDACQGRRYSRETLEIEYKGRSIDEVLQLTVEQARTFFSAVPTLARKLDTLLEVGLGYIKIGQSATTLSGGEAQRVKLSLELSKRDTGRTLYILDEPTTGLHFHDVDLLLRVLHRLCDHGNTVVVIEHNLDVIKTADWVVDLGPEGGAGGGRIVAEGTPEQVAQVRQSHTGRFLAQSLAREQSALAVGAA
jgi:excinuclease ABC subunit A